MSERPTPETERVKGALHTNWDDLLNHARRLERERDEAREKVRRQAERIRKLEGATNHAGGTLLTRANEKIEECLRDIEHARADMNSLLWLLADIRAAVGDPTGRLMQEELVERCRKLYEEKKPK